MSYSLTTNKIPDCMIRFWHSNCMTSLRGHRTPLQYSVVNLMQNVTKIFATKNAVSELKSNADAVLFLNGWLLLALVFVKYKIVCSYYSC